MRKNLISSSILLAVYMVITAFGGEVKDHDGNTYKTVKIGSQEWMAENLNVSTFRNGDTIAEAKTWREWERAGVEGKPAWSYYNNDPANGTKYGRLYNWYAVNDPRGLAPAGWHVPTDAEWTKLIDFLGGYSVAGSKMKSTIGWEKNGNGINESGFSALPGGLRYSYGEFKYLGDYGYWLAYDEYTKNSAKSRFMVYRSDSAGRFYLTKGKGFSVRCIMD